MVKEPSPALALTSFISDDRRIALATRRSSLAEDIPHAHPIQAAVTKADAQPLFIQADRARGARTAELWPAGSTATDSEEARRSRNGAGASSGCMTVGPLRCTSVGGPKT